MPSVFTLEGPELQDTLGTATTDWLHEHPLQGLFFAFLMPVILGIFVGYGYGKAVGKAEE